MTEEQEEDRPTSQTAGVRSEHMRSLRAIKAGATAGHCSHGVARDHCADHRSEEPTDVSSSPAGEAFRDGECAPPKGCGCMCHQPGGMAVKHMVACCNEPPSENPTPPASTDTDA